MQFIRDFNFFFKNFALNNIYYTKSRMFMYKYTKKSNNKRKIRKNIRKNQKINEKIVKIYENRILKQKIKTKQLKYKNI